MKLQVVDGVHGILFPLHNPDALMRAFSSLIADGRLSEFAITVASSGKLLAKNVMASDCISTYAKLLENMLEFPSDTILPGPVAKLEQLSWNWNLLEGEINQDAGDMPHEDSKQAGVVHALEEELTDLVGLRNTSENQTDTVGDFPIEQDWAVLQEIEQFEEFEKVEKEEVCNISYGTFMILRSKVLFYICILNILIFSAVYERKRHLKT